MGSGAGSKGAFVASDSDRKKIKQMRRKHGYVFPLKFDETDREQKYAKPEQTNPPIKPLKQGVRNK